MNLVSGLTQHESLCSSVVRALNRCLEGHCFNPGVGVILCRISSSSSGSRESVLSPWKLSNCIRYYKKLYLRPQYFFHNRNAVEVGSVIREAYRLQDSTPAEVNPNRMLEPFSPLTRGQYPIFNKYPKFVVDYQVNWELS